MLDLTESPTSPPIDPHTIDDKSDSDLDALPFGVVGLDDEGAILRYNLYESRFARLDRNQVIGRNFFTEVARCTRTEAFEGRFRTFVAAGGGGEGRLETFPFLFDFAFGAQEVSIDLLKAPRVDRYYLLINRSKLSPPRPDVPVELLAARQSDLASDEPGHGVLRDERESRHVDVPAPFFAAFRATCDRLAPETWSLFSQEWGVQWGRRAVMDMEASALENRGCSLGDLPMREVASTLETYLSQRGWGHPTFDFTRTADGVIVLRIERSVLAETAPPRRGSSTSPGACSMMAGFLAGTMSTLAHRRLAARELSCQANGNQGCLLVLVSYERRAALDAAITKGASTIDQVISSLRSALPLPETLR